MTSRRFAALGQHWRAALQIFAR